MQMVKIRSMTALAAMFALVGVASASPVTYNWTSGSVTVFATSGGPNLLTSPSNVIPLTSASQVTFDSAVPGVTSFLFADTGPSASTFSATAFTGANAVLNGGQIVLSNISIVPGVGYSSSGSGANPYNITMNNLSASGSYQLKNAGGATLSSGTFSNVITPTLTGQVLLGGGSNQQLALNGISLAAISVGGTSILLKGDVLFNGATPVPLPAGAWLLGSALLGLSGLRRGRRRGADSELGGSAGSC